MATIAPIECTTRDGAKYRIRSVTPDDAAALLGYFDHLAETAEFNVTLPGERKVTVEEQAKRLGELLEADNAVCLIAEFDGAIIGEISFKGHPRRRMAHHGHLGIGVYEEWRGRGVGRALMAALMDWARAHPVIEKVCLGVFAPNAPAIALYRSMGFEEECRRFAEFKIGPGQYIDDVQMSCWVKPRPAGSAGGVPS